MLHDGGIDRFNLARFSCSYGFLYGPLMLLYVKFRLFKAIRFRLLDTLHFLPFFFIIIFVLLEFYICGYIGLIIPPLLLIYYLFSYKNIFVYETTLPQLSAKQTYSELKWLKSMLILGGIIAISNLIQIQFRNLRIAGFEISLMALVQFEILMLVNMIVYQGFKNPQFFEQLPEEEIEIIKKINPNTSIKSYELYAFQELADRIESQMQEQKLYRNPDLTLRILSETISSNEKKVSQTINQVLGASFSDYINAYRINEALSLLKSAETNLTIKEIMFDVGFNSRSVFNTLFKKQTGMTPSEYKKRSE